MPTDEVINPTQKELDKIIRKNKGISKPTSENPFTSTFVKSINIEKIDQKKVENKINTIHKSLNIADPKILSYMALVFAIVFWPVGLYLGYKAYKLLEKESKQHSKTIAVLAMVIAGSQVLFFFGTIAFTILVFFLSK